MASRRVIISGGTSGIGAATARHLIGQGETVWVLGSRPESVDAAREQLPGLAGASVCQVTDESGVVHALGDAVGEMGGLDGAFVNAGIDGAGQETLELTADGFRHVLDVNVVGAFLVAREAARRMGEGAAIVINASVNALRAELRFADYNASKAAVLSLSQTMAIELAPHGITVSAICPGYIPTAMTQAYLEDPATCRELLGEIPAGRFGQPEEVAALVGFLLSSSAGYMAGAVVSIDGGRSV
jgi:NAD(P)-dependent dehydrogenase (short-subunit alcohol dehydrogenase family)